MARIRFEPTGLVCSAEAGARLVDVTDDHPGAEVPYSCRSASCGSCRVIVRRGAEAFDPPQDEEREVLDIFGDGSDVRLCCQLRIARDTPEIVLEVVDPE